MALRNRYMSALNRSATQGRAAENEYVSRARNFDPYAAAERQNAATVDQFFEDYGEDFRNLRGSQVGTGRLDTGFGAADERRLETNFMDRVGRALAQSSLAASSMDLQNIQGLGAYGERMTGRYLDLLAGERDREMMEREARRQRSAGRWGMLGGLAGSALGTILGPAGTAIGGKIGSWVGDRIGG